MYAGGTRRGVAGILIPAFSFFGICALATHAAEAQSPGQREYVDALRAELSTVLDPAVLLRRESLTIDVARVYRDSTLIHLELGWLSYRLGELTGSSSHYDDAAGEFEWAAELRPDWPYTNYGRALSEFQMGEHSVIAIENLRQLFGFDYVSHTVDALLGSIEADPGFVPAIDMLGEVVLKKRFRKPLDEVRAVFEQARNTDSRYDPQLFLAEGRFLRHLGDYDEARIDFWRALSLRAPRPEALLELARTEFALQLPTWGLAHYYDAAASINDAAEYRESFEQDLVWIATEGELARFQEVETEDFEPWLRQFWERRALIEFREPGERLAEHFRRYYASEQSYPLLSPHRAVDISRPYTSSQAEVDDRGVIYIRHGDPLRTVRYLVAASPTNETWEYDIAGKQVLLHFFASGEHLGDYRMVEAIGTSREVAESRRNLNEIYEKLGRNLGARRASHVQTEINMNRRSIATAVSTDTYPIRFDPVIDPQMQFFVFANRRGGGTVVVTFAVSTTDLPVSSGDDGMAVYHLAIRAVGVGGDSVAADLKNEQRTLRDETGDSLLLDVIEVPLDPAAPELGVMISDPDRQVGATVRNAALVAPVVRTGSYDVSDVLIGSDDVNVFWDSRNVRINPSNEFGANATASLYYEVYGLETGGEYHVRLEVRKKKSGGVFGFIGRLFGGGSGVTLEFDGRADGLVTEVRQQVELAQLGGGAHRISIEIEFPDGTSVTKERLITVRD